MQGPAENRTQIQAAQPPAAPGQAPIGPCTALRLCEYHHGRDALHILTPPSTVRSISKRGPGPRSKLLVLCELFGRPERLGGLDLSGPGCELHPLQQRASGSADVMIPAWEPLSYSGPPTPPPAREGVQEQRRYPWGSAYSPMDCLLPHGLLTPPWTAYSRMACPHGQARCGKVGASLRFARESAVNAPT